MAEMVQEACEKKEPLGCMGSSHWERNFEWNCLKVIWGEWLGRQHET